MLFAILRQAMMSGMRAAKGVHVVPALRRAFRFFASAVLSVERIDDCIMGLLSMLPFSVRR
jgi:hypothetical protein